MATLDARKVTGLLRRLPPVPDFMTVQAPRKLLLPARTSNPFRLPDGRGRVAVYVATGRRSTNAGMILFRFKRMEGLTQ